MIDIIRYILKEYEACKICLKECGVNRLRGEKGWCGIGRDSKVFNTTVLVNENDEIAPTYAIYFAGCNLYCRFCSVAEENIQMKTYLPHPVKTPNPESQIPNKFQIPNPKQQKDFSQSEAMTDFIEVSEEFMARVRKEIEDARPKTISFIGGEPSIHLLTIIELIEKLKPELPLVLYTNLYYQARINLILDEVFEFIVADLHFGNNRCAQTLTDKETTKISADYFETTTANIKAMKEKIILRHLLLPAHIECCFKRIVDWISIQMPDKPLYLLTNYFPYIESQINTDGKEYTDERRLINTELARRPTAEEVGAALDYAKNKGIIIKTLDLLKPRTEMKEAKTQNQEIVIEEDGTVAFKYLDSVALEIAHNLTWCHTELKDEIASPSARNEKRRIGSQ